MKKLLSLILALALLAGCVSALADDTKYTMTIDGVNLQNAPDRGIVASDEAMEDNPLIEGESPTTGKPADTSERYMPMLVQISNPETNVKVNGKTVQLAGVSTKSPWGGQYADIVYEGILYRSGQTRITFLFNDSFAEGQPVSAGPVRSARIGHVLLREEWQGGIVYAGGPRAEENDIAAMFNELGASKKGVTFNLLDNSYTEFKNRNKFVKAPDNYNVNVAGIRTLVPETTEAQPHPFLFADESPYTADKYDQAYSINLDWGHKKYVSHFYYDESTGTYARYMGDVPYVTYLTEPAKGVETTPMTFNNVIIQRVGYEYTNNSKIMPVMQSVGSGNADIFINGRYIAGYWVRENIKAPTVYLDDQGNEIQLSRGRTFIAHFPPESLLTYNAENRCPD